MGFDLDIIDESGKLIDRLSLSWLIRDWDTNFFSANSNKSIEYIIVYCDEQIEVLREKVNKLQNIINIWKTTDFEKRKKLIIELLYDIDDEKEFYSMIEYFTEYDIVEYENCAKLSDGSKLMADFDYYSTYKLKFEYLKKFLLKHTDYKYEFSY